MEHESRITRRTLIASCGLGILTGGTWGAAVHGLATPSSPSLSVVGKDDMQVVLLDTTDVRVLILLGTPDEDLQRQIPAMLTLLRQRVDLLVGTSSSVNALGLRFRNRWRVTHALVVAEPASAPTMSGTRTSVRENLQTDLGSGVSMELRLAPRGAWNRSMTPLTPWVAVIRSGEHEVILAPNGEALVDMGVPAPSLALVPQSPLAHIARTLGPSAIATNSREELSLQIQEPLDTVLVRIYPQDTARFEFSSSGLTLPNWHERI